MSKVTCEYCGSIVDFEKERTCPQCGAALGDNAQFLQHQKKEEELQKRRAALEEEARQEFIKRSQLENESMEAARKAAKLVKTIMITFFVVMLVVVVGVIAVRMAKTVKAALDSVKEEARTSYEQSNTVETRTDFVTAAAGYNEYANNGVFHVKVDEFKEFDPYPFGVDANCKAIAIHFLVENITDQYYCDDAKVVVLADGIVVKKRNGSYEFKQLAAVEVPPGAKNEGYLPYQIPITAQEIEIRYGDYIAFKFENPIKE